MKKHIAFLAILIVLISCNNKEAFEKEILRVKDSLQEIILEKNNSISDLKNDKFENHLKIEEVDSFINDMSGYFFNKKEIIKYFFKDFNLNKFRVVESILYSDILSPSQTELDWYSEKKQLFSNFFVKLDRSPENLKRFLTPEIKRFIFSLLKNNNIYNKSGANLLVKSLLLSYNQLKDNEEQIKEIYRVASEVKGLENMDENSPLNNYLKSVVTDNIKELLIKEYDKIDSSRVTSESYSRIRLVYTFWARRYKEGNMSFTYDFFKELDKNLSKK